MSPMARSIASGARAEREGGGERAAGGGAAHDVEDDAALAERLVDADVGRAEGPAAARNEPRAVPLMKR